MPNLVSLLLLLLILLDMNILKHLDFGSFLKIFYKAEFFIIALFLMLAAIFFSFEEQWVKFLPFCLWISFLSVYIIRRNKFVSLIDYQFLINKEQSMPLFRFSDSLGVLLLWFFTIAIFSFVLSKIIFLLGPFNSELGEMVITGFFSLALIFILIYRSALRFSNEGFFYNINMLKPKGSFIKISFLPAVSGIIFAYFSSTIIVTRQFQPKTPLNNVLNNETSYLVMLLFIFLAIFVAPFIEELVFRGYFYKVIQGLKGKKIAFFTVAIVFGALHMPQYWGDWFAIIMVFVLGFGLTAFRLWTDTAFSSVVMHYFYNCSMVIIPIFMLIFSNQPYLKYSLCRDTADFQTKEMLLRDSIEKYPDFSRAYNDLTLMYVEKSVKLERALELINKALELEPNNGGYLKTKENIVPLLKQLNEKVDKK